MSPRKSAKTSGKNLERSLAVEERRKKVLALRRRGTPIGLIAQTLGVNPSTVSKDLKTALSAAASSNDAQDLVQLELERLDHLLMGIWQDAVQGDEKKIGLVLKIMERRARFLGLDAETEQAGGGPVQIVVNPSLFPPAVQENLASVIEGEVVKDDSDDG